MTTHNSIFDTKEDYLTFRAAWASAAQNKELTSIHHVLYNLIRGVSYDRGFTPITNKNKLINGMAINGEISYACRTLRRWQKDGDFPTYFTKPLNGALTDDMLILLDIPEEPLIYGNYGRGYDVIQDIIAGDFVPVNFSQIHKALEVA